MSIEELKQKILEVITESTETELEVTEDTTLYEEMGLASVEAYVLLSDLEEAFGVRIPASALRNVRTAGDLCTLVICEMS